MKKRELKDEWREICNEYLKAFCEKHEFDYEPDMWVGDDPGTIVMAADYFVGMEEMRYDVDHDVPEGYWLEWYDYNLKLHELELPNNINFESWCKGAPKPYSLEDIRKIEELERKSLEARRILEDEIARLKKK